MPCYDWSIENKLPLNLKKTKCMTLGTRQRLSSCRELKLKVDDIIIQNVKSQKLLGVYIDENLTWSKHIDHLCSVVSSKISLLKQLAEYVPTDVQKRFYQGYILPLVDYGSVTWGSTSCANMERLSKLQKRAARIILKADFNTPSFLMFKDLNWLPVERRIKYNKAVFTYRALNKMAPEYIANLLTPMSDTHSLNLRSTDNGTLYIPKAQTSLYKGSFACSAPQLWNALPQGIRGQDSLSAFKKCLKAFL